jgi:hypothetical protein
MTAIQLKLDLWQQLQQAQDSPQDTDWRQLCLAFDQTIALTPTHQQLAIAATAIEQMAELLAARASLWFDDWGRSPDEEPVLDADLFAEFVRQSMTLDLSDLVAEPELYLRSASDESETVEGSQATYREKEEVVAELKSHEAKMEAAKAAIQGLAPDENVADWAGLIRSWLLQQGESAAPLVQIQQGTGLAIVQVWLAGMLSDLKLLQQGEFYEVESVVVSLQSLSLNLR